MYSFLQSAIFLRASNRLVNQRTRPYWTSLIATPTAVSSSTERTNIHLSSPFCAPSALSRGFTLRYAVGDHAVNAEDAHQQSHRAGNREHHQRQGSAPQRHAVNLLHRSHRC